MFAFAIVFKHKLSCFSQACEYNERHGIAIFSVPLFLFCPSDTILGYINPIIGAVRRTRLVSQGAFITCWMLGWPKITCSSFRWIVYLALLPSTKKKVRESDKKSKARAFELDLSSVAHPSRVQGSAAGVEMCPIFSMVGGYQEAWLWRLRD